MKTTEPHKRNATLTGIIGCLMATVALQGQGLTVLSFLDAPTIGTIPMTSESWVAANIWAFSEEAPAYRIESVMVAVEAPDGDWGSLKAFFGRRSRPDSLQPLGPPEEVGPGVVRFGGEGFIVKRGHPFDILLTGSRPPEESVPSVALAGWDWVGDWAPRGPWSSKDGGVSWQLISPGYPKLAIMASPVPEPSSLALLALGGWWFWLRRRQWQGKGG